MIRVLFRQGRVLRPVRVGCQFRSFTADTNSGRGTSDNASNTKSASPETTPSKPWYLRDQPVVQEQTVTLDLDLPEGTINDIAKQLARDAIYDIKYIADQNILIGSGKSSRHIYKAGREIMGVLKHKHDVLPTAEGLFKKNAQRMSYRRMLKKARKQNLEFPDSEWVVIDSRMGFHVHIFTAEKREQVNLEDLYKFEMDEEEVEITPEDFAWAEKTDRIIAESDVFLSGQQNSDPFLKSDSIAGIPKKSSSHNPFDGAMGSGQRRSAHTSAPAQSAISVGFNAERSFEEDKKPNSTVVPLFMYTEWAARGDKNSILENLSLLQPSQERGELVLSAFTNFFKLPTTGFNDVPQAIQEMFEVFSPSEATKREWREVFRALLNAYAVNHQCVPTQALVDLLVSQQAAGFAVVNSQIHEVLQLTIDSTQFEPVGVTSLVEWQRVVDAKVQIVKQLMESFGSFRPESLMQNDYFVRLFARALTQKTSASFGLNVKAKPDTTKHPLDLRLSILEQGINLRKTNRRTLYLLFAAYANSYAWPRFFGLMQRLHKNLELDEAHVETVVSLVLNSRDERAFYQLAESKLHLIANDEGRVPFNQQSAERMQKIIDSIDPERRRFSSLRRQISEFTN